MKAIPRSLCDDEKHEQSRVTNLAPNLQPFATDARPPLAESSRRLLPWLIAVAFFMESLDTTILSTGVPAIAAALHVGPLSMKSVLASYTLSPVSYTHLDVYKRQRINSPIKTYLPSRASRRRLVL